MWNLRNKTKGEKREQTKKQILTYRKLMVTRGEEGGEEGGLNR